MAQQIHTSVRLLKNHIYPTYQLHAYMANQTTGPERGLAIAVRTTLEWIADRMGQDTPEDIRQALAEGAPAEEVLFSKHINMGYLIDIVYLEEAGVWSMQISEPDLGSNPGEAEQRRPAIPGRIIETDVEYRTGSNGLECGFKTLVSDPEGIDKAEVYRLAIVRKLALNPEFGLKQIVELQGRPHIVDSKRSVEDLIDMWHNGDNQLPLIVFTELTTEEEKPDLSKDLANIDKLFPKFVPKELMGEALKNTAPKINMSKAAPLPPQYDTESFARSCIGYGITFELKSSAMDRFKTMTGAQFNAGSILILEPVQASGGYQVFSYIRNDEKRAARVEEIRIFIHQYPRDRTFDFGGISFLGNAREELHRVTENLKTAASETGIEWEKKINILKSEWAEELAKRDSLVEERNRQIQGLKTYQENLEGRNKTLQEEKEQLVTDCRAELARKEETIAYLRRRLDRPDKLTEVIDWAERHFGGRLLFHEKAKNLMKNTASTVDVNLVCDALEHLAMEYWENIYGSMTDDELLMKCSEKYNMPFEIVPNGDQSIDRYPNDYKIKYFIGPLGKPVQSPLNLHLKAGVKNSFLVRIYFLLDKEKKLIVIGSMPEHLKTMTEG